MSTILPTSQEKAPLGGLNLLSGLARFRSVKTASVPVAGLSSGVVIRWVDWTPPDQAMTIRSIVRVSQTKSDLLAEATASKPLHALAIYSSMSDPNDSLIHQIMRAHFADELRNYRGNLTFAQKVVQNEWLPEEDEPEVQEHLLTLRHHLAEIGHPEDDGFLLRLGLTVAGVQRGIVPPAMVLQVNRGGFSERRQREAAGQILRLRDALALGRKFLLGLSTDTYEALIELSDFSQRQVVPNDNALLNWFGNLSNELAEQLAARAIECLDSKQQSVHEVGSKILRRLACFRQQALGEPCCGALFDRSVFWPPSLYRDSGDAVAVQLISRLGMTTELIELNHLLLALAWTRSVVAHRAFRQWSDQLPAWAENLHLSPKAYLHAAGWSLDEDGERRDLISTSCFRLVTTEQAGLRSVACRSTADQPCPTCGSPGCWLFDFSQVMPDDFDSELGTAPRKMLCCLHCACYSPVFTTYFEDGTSEFHSQNERCESSDTSEPRPCIRRLDDSSCPTFACADTFGLADASTLGGIPMWLQDAQFPHCVECARPMTFLAQHDNGPLGEEGVYYAFFCAECHVAAVTYQQT